MKKRNIQVGLFVLAGLFFTGLVVFLIGDERRLFNSSVELRAKFGDVAGLKAGAPIRMGGIDIGHVGAVGHGKDATDTTIFVTLEIVKAESARIKSDSIVKVASKGLLGDKMLEITKGKTGGPVTAGQMLESEEPEDVFGKATDMAVKADAALDGVKRITDSLSNDKLQKDIRDSVASLNSVMHQISDGEGYPHRLLTDKVEADRISHTLETLDHTAAEMSLTLAEFRGIANRIRSGPGFAHDVLYGNGPQKQIEQFGNAAQETAVMLEGVRKSDSLAHDILYGGKGNGAEAIANVTAITADLKVITAGMRQGKGTLGALLVDPSIYEDLKVVLGNVERNDVLRALVRYSIKQDEKKPVVKVGAGGQ